MPSTDDRGLFKSTAAYYARYRPGYPDALIDHIVERFGLDGTGRLLDLGCGTGLLTLPLAAHVADAIGVDPEPEMLAQAEARATADGVGNVTWLVGSSRDLQALAPRLGVLRLATMGRSFHWMESGPTLRALATLVAPGGGIVLTGEHVALWSGQAPWEQAIPRVIARWLGPTRRAGAGVYVQEAEPWETVLARSPFSRVEPWRLAYQRRWDIDGVVGCLYSTSFCSPALLGDKQAGFERDLRQTLLAINPDGEFIEDVDLVAMLAWRV